MLRTATYRLLRAAEVAPLDASGLGQLVLRCAPQLERNLVSPWHARPFSGAAAEEEQREITNPKVLELAEQITQLNLLEVSDLTEILRKRLNIQAPAGGMGFAFPPPGMAAPAASASGKLSTLKNSILSLALHPFLSLYLPPPPSLFTPYTTHPHLFFFSLNPTLHTQAPQHLQKQPQSQKKKPNLTSSSTDSMLPQRSK